MSQRGVWRWHRFQSILSAIDMIPERDGKGGEFSPGGRRYSAPALRESRASGSFGPPVLGSGDGFHRALKELSSEDEDLPSTGDQGPIVFKDGIFQIDMSGSGNDSPLDPALKGLIDSILRP